MPRDINCYCESNSRQFCPVHCDKPNAGSPAPALTSDEGSGKSGPGLMHAVCVEAANHMYSKQDMDRVREMARAALCEARGEQC